MTIRIMQETDAAAIADLSTQLGYPASEARVAGRIKVLLAKRGDLVLVASSDEGRAIGWIHLREFISLHGDPTGEICGMVVDSEHRGRGIGTQMIAAAEQWAKTQGLRSMRVRSNAIRKETHRFYQGLGFQMTKTSLTFEKDLEMLKSSTECS